MRYFIEISYNGKNYAGWQVQENAIGVQNIIENCLSKLLKNPIEIQGSGRTDKGVHCAKQFAHFDCPEIPFAKPDFLHKINAFLPKDIAIRQIYEVNQTAHARFDAVSRTYIYVISNRKNPFLHELSYQFNKPLNFNEMRLAANLLKENDDFTSFSKLHSASETNLCKIKNLEITPKGDFIFFTITANRFLRGMVRLLVGSLLEIGLQKMSVAQLETLINAKDVRKAPAAVPAEGLFLVNVIYPNKIFIAEPPDQTNAWEEYNFL